MTPPLNLKNCPKEFQKNPLPFDECAPANPDWREPAYRFPQLSLGAEYSYLLAGRSPTGSNSGILALYRPLLYLGIGAQLGGNFTDQVQFLGRIQTSFNLHTHGLFRGTIAALFGFNHLMGSPRSVDGFSEPPAVSGDVLTGGGEMALDIRVFNWMSVSPFTRVLYQPATSFTLDANPGQEVRVKPGVDLSLGVRLSFEFFDKGK